MSSIRLTQYSHGAGCGCKISPKVLDTILKSQIPGFDDPTLVVGNSSSDEAKIGGMTPAVLSFSGRNEVWPSYRRLPT